MVSIHEIIPFSISLFSTLDSFNIFSAQLPPYCDDAPVDDGVDVHLDLRMQPNEHPLKHHLYLNVHYALATIYMAKSLASFAYVCNGTRKRKNVKFNFINLCNRNCIFFASVFEDMILK